MENNQLKLIKVTNPFDRADRTEEVLEITGNTTLAELVLAHVPEGVQVTASIDGTIIPETDWGKTIVPCMKQILLVPTIQGGGGGFKAVFNAIAMIAITVASFVLLPFGGPLAIGTAALIGMAGGLLLNSLTPTPKAASSNFGALNSNPGELSQAYGWNPATMQQVGLSVPIFYGKNKLTGNVISAFTEPTANNDKQVLNCAIALCRGPIKSISDCCINGQSVENM